MKAVPPLQCWGWAAGAAIPASLGHPWIVVESPHAPAGFAAESPQAQTSFAVQLSQHGLDAAIGWDVLKQHLAILARA